MNKLKFYTQSILPLVYDDSLSYVEVLYKFKSKLNEIIDVINTIFADKISSYIERHFNEIMFEAIYSEENETITISKSEV